jgi:hypothetical protein
MSTAHTRTRPRKTVDPPPVGWLRSSNTNSLWCKTIDGACWVVFEDRFVAGFWRWSRNSGGPTQYSKRAFHSEAQAVRHAERAIKKWNNAENH